MDVLRAVADQQVAILFAHASDTTALTLTDFTVEVVDNGSRDADAETTYSVTVTEIDAVNLPGLYRVLLTPAQRGELYVRLSASGDEQSFILQVDDEALDLIGHVYRDGEADFVFTVDDGTDAVEGVVVSVYSGTTLISRGTTDSDGELTLTLPEGSYTARYRKSGYSWDAETITVQSSDYNAPLVTALLPDSAAEGDFIVIRGFHFNHDDVEVLFDGDSQATVEVSPDGRVILVEVLSGLSNTAVAVQVQKPHPTSGDLTSNSVTLENTT